MYRNNVIGLIFNSKSKVLIGKYNSSRPSWTFPKGGIENNESLDSAIYREIYEELGINKVNLEILYYYEKDFIKNFTQKEINWKIKNKGEYYIGKKEKIILIKYNGNESEINLCISNELSEYKFIEVIDIPYYIDNNDLIKFIDINFLIKMIYKY